MSAFEVKLVAVPTSGTARMPRDEQCCELVVRPPSIEQLCFSFAASFGPLRRQEVGEVIVAELGSPIDYEWSNERLMKRHRSNVLAASNELIRRCIPKQKPLVLIGEWRTQGQEPVLITNATMSSFFQRRVPSALHFCNEARNRDKHFVHRSTSTSLDMVHQVDVRLFCARTRHFRAYAFACDVRRSNRTRWDHSLLAVFGLSSSQSISSIRVISVNETNEILLPEAQRFSSPNADWTPSLFIARWKSCLVCCNLASHIISEQDGNSIADNLLRVSFAFRPRPVSKVERERAPPL